MFPEQYRTSAIIFFSLTLLFGFLSYSLLGEEPSQSQLGITLTSGGYIYPTYHLVPHGVFRSLLALVMIVCTCLVGFMGVYFISWYIDYQRRS